MRINKKQKNFTIIIIQDERRLCSFKFPLSFLTTFLLAMIGISVVVLTAFLLHDISAPLNKEGLANKIQTFITSPDARNNEAHVNSSTTDSVVQSYNLSIDKFKARFDLSKKTFHYSFVLRNRTSKSSTASGYIFVILKSESSESEYWFVNPHTVLSNGVPQNFRDGEPFSISKHKVITKDISVQNIYDSAMILVYSDEGNLVLRETFNLQG